MTKYFNFVLTESQVDFLAESKNGVNIMKVLTVLLIHTCTDSGYNYARPGWNSYLHSGQTLISDAELAEFCNCDVETVSDIIRMLNNSGLISTMSNSSVSIHTLLFLDEIHDKGKTVYNSRCQDKRLREEESIYQTQMALKYAEVKVVTLSQRRDSRKNAILEERDDTAFDWTAEVIANSTIDDLEPDAIMKAREGYKQRYPKLAKECDGWSDKVFLDKAGLTVGGKVTRATLLLVGKETSAYKLNHIAQIVWKCFQDGQVFGDIYTIPFVLTTTELLHRIRNYRFKIYPKNSLIPAEVWKYDTESILEGMHNSIAHQNYEKGARIIVTEDKDSLKFQNDGTFFEGDYRQYITGEKTPKSYRNPALVKAMVNIKMIDTQGYGIHKMFVSQKERFLPMPDYDLSTADEVVLNMPGTIIDENYSLMLLANQDLSLTDAVLLDQVQKSKEISPEAVAMLRKRKLIEGRLPHIYVAKDIAQVTGQKVEYSKHKGLADKKCEALLLESLNDHKTLSKQEIVRLLWDLLPDQLEDKQKINKIDYLLKRLRMAGIIINETKGSDSVWSLGKP